MRLRFLLTRLAWTIFVLIGASLVIFFILHVVPGDPARAMLGPLGTPEAIETLRRQLGLDQPLVTQYYLWISRALSGDLGHSILLSQSVSSLLGERLQITLILSGYALVFAILIAIPASIISATRRNTVADYAGRFIALVGLAMPGFWLGLMLILFFGATGPDCTQCRHFYITWRPPRTRGCRAYGFESESYPSAAVLRESGSACKQFERKVESGEKETDLVRGPRTP